MTIEFFKYKPTEEDLEYDKMLAESFEKKGIPFPQSYELPEPKIKLEPKLEPQYINCDMLDEYTPEKIELGEGALYFGEPMLSRMFLLHLYNIGLKEAVKFAPKELWLQALEEE